MTTKSASVSDKSDMGKDIAIQMEESEDDVEMNGGKPQKAKSSQAKVTEFFPNKKKVQRAGNGAVTEGQHGEKTRERKQRASAQSCEEHAVVKAGGEAKVPEHGAYPSCLAGSANNCDALRAACDAIPCLCVSSWALQVHRPGVGCMQAGRLKVKVYACAYAHESAFHFSSEGCRIVSRGVSSKACYDGR